MGQQLQMCLRILVVLSLIASLRATDTLHHSNRTATRDWGPWTGWSACSQTCGFGTAYRIRLCHNLRKSDSRDHACQGLSKQYKLCVMKLASAVLLLFFWMLRTAYTNMGTSATCGLVNETKNCLQGEADYRTVECAKHNSALYGHKTHTWIPYINILSPCELSCKSVAADYYARFQKTVADFVICNEENTAVCIQGQCVESGCDGILGSGVQVDRCGACGGDGTTCRVIQGIFTRTHLNHRGYNIITTIPEGARSINITEMSRSSNHLALSTGSGYFLNGDMRLQPEGLVRNAGTTFKYGRGTGQWCPGECLTAPGPINTSIRAELVYSNRNPGIYYHFTVPRQQHHDVSTPVTSFRGLGSALYKWEDGDNHQSDTGIVKGSTNPGIKQHKSPIYLPDRQTVNSLKKHQVSSSETSLTTSSLDQHGSSVQYDGEDVYSRSYRQHPHESHDKLRQQVGFMHNSKHGELGDQVSRVSQESSANNNLLLTGDSAGANYMHYYHTSEHDDIGEVHMASPLPDDSSDLESTSQDRVPSWLASNGLSDDGFITASVQNQQAVGQASSRLDFQRTYNGFDNLLPGHADDLHVYSWRISGFTACSEPCGGGLQETRLVCVKHGSQLEVVKENCERDVKPESTTVVCNNQPCDARWEIGDWGPCSVTCGRGLQNRSIECQQRVSATLTLSVPASGCIKLPPQGRQFCQLDPCFTWRVSNWSKCSSECGLGQRTRAISCVDIAGNSVNDSLCIQDRPSLEDICDMGSCAQGWFHTRWSLQCSAKCGKGYHTRQVYCSSADGSRLQERKCSSKEKKPSQRKLCSKIKPCRGQWFGGPWSQCNTTCGPDAFRYREVLCVRGHGKKQVVMEHNCHKEDRPSQVEPCGPVPECKPQWFVMAWTQCSKSCGSGVKTREVKCLDSFFTPNPDCDKMTKPSRRQPCNTQLCIEKYTSISVVPPATTNEALQVDLSDGSTAVESSTVHPKCEDSQSSRWCQMAKQARLCNYTQYETICCHTCRNLDPKSIS